MDSMNLIKDEYKIGGLYRYLVENCCRCACKEKYKSIQNKKFYGRWLKVERACQPEEIIWQNIGYSGASIFCRKFFIWIIAIILIILGIFGMSAFQFYSI